MDFVLPPLLPCAGSPAGVGAVQHGDVINASVAGIGEFTLTVAG